MDNMVKVNPKLFVTCRLCLEDLGLYQIVPQVQQQIKYCFDIDVGLFDGLPQLVCQKCKTILQDYYEVKQNFVAKQATLKHTHINDDNQTDDVREGSPCSSTQAIDENIKLLAKRKRYRLPSSSSSDNLDVQNPVHSEPVKKRSKSSKSSWKSFYKRKFICQLCSKVCKKKNSLNKHLKKHNSLIACYPNVFSRDCKIQMIKLDDIPNMTGSNNSVVYSSNRIISNEGSYNHCVVYTPKKSFPGSRLNSSDGCENNQDLANGDSSDDDIKDSRTRSRTRSSNETVILKDDNTYDGHEQGNGGISDKDESFSDGDCIKIDDSSDTESTNSNNRVLRDSADTNTVRANVSDHKAIQNIITICCKRYRKKFEGTESEAPAVDEEKLKRIILNMGQKVVTKQGFNCAGLLRFMLNADLNIKWIQANCRSPKDSNYVYIQPKLVNKSSVNNADPGWIDVPGQHHIPINHVFESEENENKKICSNVPAMIISQTDNSQGKLLNESPVANPKQLPKKTYANQSSENNDPNSENTETNFETGEVNGEMCMPIITSTTSLAVPSIEAQETPSAIENAVVPNITTNESEKCHPRIKVKPVSELMSERVLKTMNQTQVPTTNIWDTPQPANILPVTISHVPLLMSNGTSTLPMEALRVIPSYESGSSAAEAAPAAAAATGGAGQPAQPPRPARAANTDFVVLDTVELPNTRTDSPFKYVKKLLQMHNLVLLESHESLTREFVCLIKFKLQFKQDNVQQPVVLFLSVQCSGNKFYLGVKHSELDNNIDLCTLPANWQWEIINKVYREEVVNKVLKNAQKICQSTHDYTKSFMCLLKSIKKREV